MPLILPFTSDPSQTFTTNLGDQKFVIDARWNEAGAFWTMDLTRSSDRVTIVTGVPLLIGQDVLAPYGLGIGGIAVTDLANTATDATAEDGDLGGRVAVAWLSPDELAQVGAA